MNAHVEEVRAALVSALDTYKAQATTYRLQLPGSEWEKFPLSQGECVEWRQEPVSHGRMVRFRVSGPCSIGLHYHESPEVIIAAVGILFYTVGGATRALLPGETYTAQPHEIHSAHFRESGEALAHWTDLEGDSIDVSFFV